MLGRILAASIFPLLVTASAAAAMTPAERWWADISAIASDANEGR
jgi:hypothetical protein